MDRRAGSQPKNCVPSNAQLSCRRLLQSPPRREHGMEPLITSDIFAAYLKCETKAYLIAIDTPVPPHQIHDWQVRLATDYKTECLTCLSAAYENHLCYDGTPSVGENSCAVRTRSSLTAQLEMTRFKPTLMRF